VVGAGFCARNRTGIFVAHHLDRRAAPVFLAAALLAYINLLGRPDWRWAIVLGVSLGLGMLAKYAMVYFVLCAALACFVDRDARVLATRPQTLIALLIGVALLLPNIYWNATHDFLTFKHTGDNIAGDGVHLQLSGAIDFFGGQFGVMGPMVFAVFCSSWSGI